jgi:hypothetical protein
METQMSGGESGQGKDDIFIAVEGKNQRSGEGGQQRWCKFNTSVLAKEGR